MEAKKRTTTHTQNERDKDTGRQEEKEKTAVLFPREGNLFTFCLPPPFLPDTQSRSANACILVVSQSTAYLRFLGPTLPRAACSRSLALYRNSRTLAYGAAHQGPAVPSLFCRLPFSTDDTCMHTVRLELSTSLHFFLPLSRRHQTHIHGKRALCALERNSREKEGRCCASAESEREKEEILLLTEPFALSPTTRNLALLKRLEESVESETSSISSSRPNVSFTSSFA